MSEEDAAALSCRGTPKYGMFIGAGSESRPAP